MMSNTELWDALGETDPSFTRNFKRGGGFSGTAVSPMWIYRKLTEKFGPVGVGWGHNKPDFQLVDGPGGDVLVFCTVECWHTNRETTFFGVGGDKVFGTNKNGTYGDDEAFKKAFTDAVTNAFKSLGAAADVHMGMFDDNTYVEAMERKFAPPPACITDAQRDEIALMAQGAGVALGAIIDAHNKKHTPQISDLRELPAERYEGVVNRLKLTMAKNAAKKKETA